MEFRTPISFLSTINSIRNKFPIVNFTTLQSQDDLNEDQKHFHSYGCTTDSKNQIMSGPQLELFQFEYTWYAVANEGSINAQPGK